VAFVAAGPASGGWHHDCHAVERRFHSGATSEPQGFSRLGDRQAAATTTVYVILRVVDNLKTILSPILPHTPVLRTGHRSCTSTWAMRGSPSTPLRAGSLGRSRWSSTKRRRVPTGR